MNTPDNKPLAGGAEQARRKIRIGDLLVKHRVISESQLESALAEQKRSGHKLGITLVELGFINEKQLLEFLSQQLQIPFIDLKKYKLDPQVVQLLPEAQARRYRALVLEVGPRDALVGMADPTDLFAFDQISSLLKRHIRQAVVWESDLLRALDLTYRRTEELSSLAGELDEELAQGDIDLGLMMEGSGESEAPVFRLLRTLFEDALQVKASDIHIEPDEEVLRIRQRVDGVLHEQVMNELRIAPALVQRLKLMAHLDISEKRLPQDGRFQIKVKDHSVDVRLSTMPVQYGEAVVMRLLDQSAGILSLNQLGIPEGMAKDLRGLIHHPHGLVLVTGPTGSGKTTTLYAALTELNRPEKKIITVEDPVEYRLSRANQVQVHDQIGLTFSTILRTALRQDPDILLVGEMRDAETAQIGVRAAITGHLVLSTLHTNSAIGTVARIVDMGVPGYLLASALLCIVAQRLVRRVCVDCKEPVQPDEQQRTWLENKLGPEHSDIQFYRGAGCNSCQNRGYSGRIGVYELLRMDAGLARALRDENLQEFADLARQVKGFKLLEQAALDYAIQGITTLEEVIAISGDVEAVERA
jgi:MSHA biogenesis protein MshE